MKLSWFLAYIAFVLFLFGGWGRELFGMPAAWIKPLAVAGLVAGAGWALALLGEAAQRKD